MDWDLCESSEVFIYSQEAWDEGGGSVEYAECGLAWVPASMDAIACSLGVIGATE